uniref:INT2 n=1 Tax=Arundo donax TaxID=35708 RepID=A0A0A9T6X7_ARUDO
MTPARLITSSFFRPVRSMK